MGIEYAALGWLKLATAVSDLRLSLVRTRLARALDDPACKYAPDQPRAPKGTSQGGQWIDADSGTSLHTISERVRAAQVEGAGSISLLDHEGIGGAHTIAEHVGKSDAYLLARVGGGAWRLGPKTLYRYRAGSFISLGAANRLVNSTLSLNLTIVQSVARGIKPDAFIVAEFGSPTGKEAFRANLTSHPYIRPTMRVAVYIVHDPSFLSGFRVQTAFPLSE